MDANKVVYEDFNSISSLSHLKKR